VTDWRRNDFQSCDLSSPSRQNRARRGSRVIWKNEIHFRRRLTQTSADPSKALPQRTGRNRVIGFRVIGKRTQIQTRAVRKSFHIYFAMERSFLLTVKRRFSEDRELSPVAKLRYLAVGIWYLGRSLPRKCFPGGPVYGGFALSQLNTVLAGMDAERS
jgi:hypothetical protein